jgi:hypothetical protein
MRRVTLSLALSLVVLSTSGCASFWRGAAGGPSLAPSGLPWGEELTRRALVVGAFDQAMARTARGGDGLPSDRLLAALYRGQVAYHAGQYDESVAAFALAEQLADERATKSVTRGLGSILFNDHTLHYVPTRTERLFARYYALLARLESGDVDAATVEARRLSALLEAAASDLDAGERATHAALREVAGAVFESAGEWNDAGVAYRNAALLRGVARDRVDSIRVTAPAADSATLVLVVEEGFAGHLVARSVALPADATAPDASRRRGRMVPSGTPRPGTTVARAPVPTDALPSRGSRGRRDEPMGGVPTNVGAARGSRGPTSSAPRDWSLLPGDARDSAFVRDSVDREARPVAADSGATMGRDSSLTDRWMAALSAVPGNGVVEEVAMARGDSVGDPNVWSHERTSLLESVAADWTPRDVRRTRYLGSPWAGNRWHEVAWPMLVRSRLPAAPLALHLFGAARTGGEADAVASGRATERAGWSDVALRDPIALASLDAGALIGDAMGADARRRLPAQLARLAARVGTRAAISEAVREEHGDAAGWFVQAVGAAMERPDTRGWHLLPGRLRVVRVTVPAGALRAEVRQGAGPNALPLRVPQVEVAPGAVSVRALRVWRDGAAVASDPARAVLTVSH